MKKTVNVLLFILLVAAAAFGRRAGGIAVDPSEGADALTAAIMKADGGAYEANMRGLDAIDKKDYASAIASFDEALAIFPNYSDALNNKGVALQRRGNAADALRTWEAVIRMDHRYALAYYNIGLLHLKEKRPEEARKQFDQAVRHNAKFTEAIVRLGVMFMEANNLQAAVNQFEKAYKATPAHQDAWSFYAHGLLLTGDTARAVTVLKTVGENLTALSQLGRIEGVRGNHRAAEEYFARAVKLGGGSALLLELALAQTNAGNCKGALLTLDGYFGREAKPAVDAWLLAGFAANSCEGAVKALHYYERGLRQYPNDQLLRSNAAQIHFTQKNYDQAQKMWDGATGVDTDPAMLHRRAVAARAQNDLRGAQRFIERAIALDEKAEYHDFLGVIYHTTGNGAKAEEHFRKALKIDPNNVSAQLNLAMKSANAADLGGAIAEASKRLAACKSKCADQALSLSILYYHQRKLNDAVSTLNAVNDRDKNINIYRHLAIFYRELKDYEKAAAALETAVSRFKPDQRIEYDLAEIYLAASKPGSAVKIFTSLLPRWKDNVWRLHYQLGYAYMELNDLLAAKASFERSIAIQDNPASRGLLAFVLNRMGETEQAMTQWERTAKEDTQNPVIFINLGLSHENKGEYEKALENYKKALALKPSEKAVNINIGNAYQGLGKLLEAQNAYTAGLESSKREEAAYNIFLLSQKRNDRERAQRMHDLLRKEFPSSVHFARVSAEMELLRGDTAKALRAFEGIRNKDTQDWFTLSKIYAARGDRQKAMDALSKLPAGGQWERDKKIIQAQLAFNGRDFKSAFTLYRDIVRAANTGARLSTSDLDIYMYNMVLCAHNAGMHKEAIDAGSDVIKRISGQNRAEICRLAGNSAVALRDWNSAKQWFTQLTAVETRNASALFNLAVAHYNLGEIEQAHAQYTRAREIDRTIRNADIENRYEQFKRGGAAAPAASQRDAKRPPVNDTLDRWYNEAVDLHTAKKEAEAEKLYKRIIERDPSYSLAWNNLGAIYGARGDLDEAVNAYTKALENQTAPETYANLANVLIALEKLDDARGIVKKGLEHNPNNRHLVRIQKQIAR